MMERGSTDFSSGNFWDNNGGTFQGQAITITLIFEELQW